MTRTQLKKIALFGGSFDPPHNGHILNVRKILLSEQYDEIWLIPSGDNRYDKKTVAAGKDRLQLLQKIVEHEFQGDKRIKIKDDQITNEELERSYAVELVEFYRKNNDQVEFYYVIGTDNINGLGRWKGYEKLISTTKFLALSRGGFDKIPTSLPDHIVVLNSDKISSLPKAVTASSSEIRKRIAEYESGKSLQDLVPQCITKDILKLYRS